MKRPYDLVVPSPTGRAKCKLCSELIKKGVTRVGVQYLYKNMNQWRCQYYHETCVKSEAGSSILQKLNLDPSLSRKRKQGEMTTTTQEDMLNIGAASAQKAERRQQNIIDERHDLREALRRARMNVATNLDRPAYTVFSNKTLDDLVLRMPSSDSELLGVFGFGATKVTQYGGICLPIIASYKKKIYGQKARTSTAAASVSVSSPQCVTQLNSARRDLREALQRARMNVATNLDKPAFMVFSNKTLDDLVVRMPCSDSELLGIFGFGATKVRQYGGIFLPIIASYKKKMYGQKRRASSDKAASVSSPQCVTQLNSPRRDLREALRRTRMPVCVTQLKHINDDDDDEVIIESEISIDQMIQRKIRAAQERGEIIELEL